MKLRRHLHPFRREFPHLTAEEVGGDGQLLLPKHLVPKAVEEARESIAAKPPWSLEATMSNVPLVEVVTPFTQAFVDFFGKRYWIYPIRNQKDKWTIAESDSGQRPVSRNLIHPKIRDEVELRPDIGRVDPDVTVSVTKDKGVDYLYIHGLSTTRFRDVDLRLGVDPPSMSSRLSDQRVVGDNTARLLGLRRTALDKRRLDDVPLDEMLTPTFAVDVKGALLTMPDDPITASDLYCGVSFSFKERGDTALVVPNPCLISNDLRGLDYCMRPAFRLEQMHPNFSRALSAVNRQ